MDLAYPPVLVSLFEKAFLTDLPSPSLAMLTGCVRNCNENEPYFIGVRSFLSFEFLHDEIRLSCEHQLECITHSIAPSP